MGMYDDIKLEIDCPKCGTKMQEFQSKDGPCILAELEYWEVSNFYGGCPKCKVWIEFNRKIKEVPLSDFEMEVKE